MTAEDYAKLFYYDETSPTCMRWAVEIRSGEYQQFQKTYIGKVAGGVSTSTGYHQINFSGVVKRVHRIIYEMIYGEIPQGFEIDHVNGIRTDNRIENLRCVSPSQNQRNKCMQSNNNTGITGVVRETKLVAGKEYKYYITLFKVSIDSTKNKKKYFSVAKLGEEKAFLQACEYRDKMIAQLNEQGAGYTDRHGK